MNPPPSRASLADPPAAAAPATAEKRSQVFIARQPIFDRQMRVAGYELLFRSTDNGPGSSAARVVDSTTATASVVLNALTEIGLDRIVGPHVAWINMPRAFLLGGLAAALPVGRTLFEVLENEQIDGYFVDAVRNLKAQGYQVALDDFSYHERYADLLPLADVIKLDYLEHGPEGLGRQLELLRDFRGQLLAEKVETHEVHAYCEKLGFHYFQGYFYRRPELMARKRIELNRGSVMRVIAALQNPALDLEEVEPLIARDLPLSLRLLRYVNSAFFGLINEIGSVRQALIRLGLDNVRRWATLTVLGGIDGKPPELTKAALVRARFCELSADDLGLDRSTCFTIGLFSLVDAMLDCPLPDLVAGLPFSRAMADALVDHSGPMGALLDAVIAIEDGYFGDAKMLLPAAGTRYVESLVWADEAASALFASIRG